MKRLCPALALLLAACGTPPAAGEDDAQAQAKAQAILTQGAAEAKAGWQKGLTAPPFADTLDAEVACTLQWETWGMAINDGRLVDQVMAAMPPEIQLKPAFDIHARWSEKALSRQDKAGGDPRPIFEATGRLRPAIEAAFDGAFTGKPGALEAYVEKLSACRNP